MYGVDEARHACQPSRQSPDQVGVKEMCMQDVDLLSAQQAHKVAHFRHVPPTAHIQHGHPDACLFQRLSHRPAAKCHHLNVETASVQAACQLVDAVLGPGRAQLRNQLADAEAAHSDLWTVCRHVIAFWIVFAYHIAIMAQPTREELARMIDHAVLRPDATLDQVQAACELVRQFGVRSLCVRPCDVMKAAKQLTGSGIAVGTVVGFPHGTTHSQTKITGTRRAISEGAEEFDMVINIGRLKDGELTYVRDEIAAVVQAATGRIVKVILECCWLNRDQMAAGCRAAAEAGANFVKTSTGFGEHGARAEDVRFLRDQVGEALGVKAAGGICTLTDALTMIAAGATRIGTSSTEKILSELDA